jgi:hypothetical protein
MAFSVNDNGTWKTVKKLSVNDGTWKAVKSGWINKDGVWTKFYASDTTITITGGNNINLRSLYETQTGDFSSTPVDVSFIVTGNVGSTSTSTPALDTGIWPTGSNVTLTNNEIIAGAGGAGGYPGQEMNASRPYRGQNGFPGGTAINLRYSLTCINNYVIGGGGGGGGGGVRGIRAAGNSTKFWAGGAGGAGITAGAASACVTLPGAYCVLGTAGSEFSGGSGGAAGIRDSGKEYYCYGGNGGSLGSPGDDATPGYRSNTSYPPGPNYTYPGVGGAAGVAIARNGNTLTLTGQTNQVYGSIT